MNNQNQPLTIETFIKRLLIIIIGTIGFAVVGTFFTLGRIPLKPLFIAIGFIVPLMIVSAIFGFKYQKQILQKKILFSILFFIIGIGMIVVNGILLLIENKAIYNKICKNISEINNDIKYKNYLQEHIKYYNNFA